MKTLILSLLILASSIQTANAQLYGTSHIHNSTVVEEPGIYTIDPDTGFWLDLSGAFLPGFTVTGINAVTIHPKITPDPNGYSGKMYAILKISGVTGRVLATIDPVIDPGNGNTTQIGNLGDNFSSLAFDSTGQLYGATGDGAAVPEALYLIDKTNAAKTLLFAMGNGDPYRTPTLCTDAVPDTRRTAPYRTPTLCTNTLADPDATSVVSTRPYWTPVLDTHPLYQCPS